MDSIVIGQGNLNKYLIYYNIIIYKTRGIPTILLLQN